jgi:hypothetical protein
VPGNVRLAVIYALSAHKFRPVCGFLSPSWSRRTDDPLMIGDDAARRLRDPRSFVGVGGMGRVPG